MSILTKIIKKMVPKDIHTYRTLHPPLPKHIYIDPSSYCQLQCPLCPTGTRTIKLDKQMMSLTDFKRYIDHFRIIKQIDLYNWGEPFLNPQLLDIIRYAKSKNIFVTIDSNFSLYFTDKKLDDILSSGLDVLRVALDGATQKSYNAYRKNGNFPLVLDNLRRLRQRQNITGKGTLQIIWKFLVNKYSQYEIDKAKKIAKKIDVEINFDKMMLSEYIPDLNIDPRLSLQARKELWLPTQKEYVQEEYLRTGTTVRFPGMPCPYLFNSPVIHPDGTILPCCYVANEASSMGNLRTTSFKDIWYSAKYQYARSLFVPGAKVKRVSVVCEKCFVYQRVNNKV